MNHRLTCCAGRFGLCGLLPALLLGACQAVAVTPEKDALLLNPGIEAQQELRATVARLINHESVKLSDKDLTESSYLAVERVRLRDKNGELMQGRETEKPHTFHLVKQGDACWLVYVNTGQRSVLSKAQCREK
ncbi:hypothetical protein ACFQAT_25470 [Undibacterium arcticum]|uniref:Lipoprotein n=1 Tax=Undibacterium arcticum TaxID=1762892 RepID=A0ABV7F325_9BURK